MGLTCTFAHVAHERLVLTVCHFKFRGMHSQCIAQYASPPTSWTSKFQSFNNPDFTVYLLREGFSFSFSAENCLVTQRINMRSSEKCGWQMSVDGGLTWYWMSASIQDTVLGFDDSAMRPKLLLCMDEWPRESDVVRSLLRQFEPQCRRVELTEAVYNERSMSYDDSFAFWGRFEDRAWRTGSGV